MRVARGRLGVVSAAVGLFVAFVVVGSGATAGADSASFSCAAVGQPWVVPAGVTSATFDVLGAAGGVGYPGSTPGNVGGKGGEATATIAVTPGEILTIFVGCKGGDGITSNPAPGGTGSGHGGAGGGGNPGGGGGGGTAVLRGSIPLIVAGGGGGSAPNQSPPGFGGAGGGGNLPGGDGDPGYCAAAASGHGATVSGAGSGGTSQGDGADAVGANGGNGAAPTGQSTAGGGGGGGGHFGGGGGASFDNSTCGGGGGGSGYIDPAATGASGTSGVRSGDGAVTVTVTVAPAAVPLAPKFTG